MMAQQPPSESCRPEPSPFERQFAAFALRVEREKGRLWALATARGFKPGDLVLIDDRIDIENARLIWRGRLKLVCPPGRHVEPRS
jgi:hypothetical protein